MHGCDTDSRCDSVLVLKKMVVLTCTVCAKKKLPCTVRFTLDRLMKTEVKRLLNGLRTDIERTTHGRGTDRARSVPFYVCTYYARVTIKFYACIYNASICRGFRIAPHACSYVIEKLSAIQC